MNLVNLLTLTCPIGNSVSASARYFLHNSKSDKKIGIDGGMELDHVEIFPDEGVKLGLSYCQIIGFDDGFELWLKD
eukprot:1029015-Ditylum_brightwellii.AAC.1